MGQDLSSREKEVLILMAEGLENSQIAEKLTVSSHTAKAHVCNLLMKLGADNRTQAVSMAFRKGLIT